MEWASPSFPFPCRSPRPITEGEILLADDHPIWAAMKVLLRDTGYEVVGMAGTGEAALTEDPGRLRPTLLLDIQMPGGSGLEVLRQLRAEKSSVGVILLTAAVDDTALLEAKALKVRNCTQEFRSGLFAGMPGHGECGQNVGFSIRRLAKRSRKLASTANHASLQTCAPRTTADRLRPKGLEGPPRNR